MGGNRFCGADVQLCAHKGFRVSRVTWCMRCGKWNLALIFNHTFDSEKSNPPFHQFSSIQFRKERKKKNKLSGGINNFQHAWQEVDS